MVIYQNEGVKVTNTRLNKLKPPAKNKKRAILRLNIKWFWRWRIVISIICNKKTISGNMHCHC